MYEDKTLVCKECGKEFVFSAGEQEFYAGGAGILRRTRVPERAPTLQGLPGCPESRRPRPPGILHGSMRRLRWRGAGSL